MTPLLPPPEKVSATCSGRPSCSPASLGLLAFFVINASRNMRDAGIASGFDFLFRTAGIEVPFVLTDYTAQSNNLALLWVGIVNTMLITLVSAAAATVLGFLIGIARLSRNWLLSTLAGAYVEAMRNIPLLFFVLFWYFGVIAALPGPRQSIADLRRRVPQQSRTHHPAAELRLALRQGRARDPRRARSSRSASPGGRGAAATAPARTRRCGPSARCCSSSCRSSR